MCAIEDPADVCCDIFAKTDLIRRPSMQEAAAAVLGQPGADGLLVPVMVADVSGSPPRRSRDEGLLAALARANPQRRKPARRPGTGDTVRRRPRPSAPLEADHGKVADLERSGTPAAQP